MPSQDRRAAARRRAWGRGPIILRFESLEGRQLLAANALPDLVGNAVITSTPSADWGDSFNVVGSVLNQGKGTANESFQVQLFASTTPGIGPKSIPLGEVTIPGGLAAEQTASYNETVTLPSTPLSGFAGKPVYINVWVNPNGAVKESNTRNNHGVGKGRDTGVIGIAATPPSNLEGSSLSLSSNQVTWGQQVTVTAQVRNNAQGAAPATRAAVVLTPAGAKFGTDADVTIGYVNVPAVPAWQTVNVVQTITLPAAAPTALGDATGFVLSLVQDADYATDPMYPHQPSQGTGLDLIPITITTDPNSTAKPAPVTDLAAGAIQAPTDNLAWGHSFQVTGTVQNVGQADAGPFHVSFLLTGANGTLDRAIYIGGADVAGLKAGANQDITQTLSLPNRLPSGVTLSSAAIGRIAMIVDPEDVVNDTVRTNNLSESNPVKLRVLGTDGSSTVPTQAAAGITLGTVKTQGTLHPIGQGQTAAQAALNAAAANRRLHRRYVPKSHSVASKVEHKLRVFPDKVSNFFNDLFK